MFADLSSDASDFAGAYVKPRYEIAVFHSVLPCIIIEPGRDGFGTPR
jgi:hypothetical protein